MKKQKLVHGVGVMDADYDTRITTYITDENGKRKRVGVWRCPIYSVWSNMLQRCYYDKFHVKQPEYKSCEAVEDWQYFSGFRNWMSEQDWEGKELDKDLLFKGNKVYGPDTCVFVSKKVNCFLREKAKSNLVGATWDTNRGKWFSCCRGLDSKTIALGRYNTEIEAHMAWLKCKTNLAYELAKEQSDPRVAKALVDYYENYYD